MNINEYQEAVNEYKPYNNEISIFFNLIEITSSVGDLNKKVNSILMNGQDMTKELSLKLGISIGDILNSLSRFAYDIGLKLEDVALLNLKKLDMQRSNEIKKKNNEPIKIK